MGPGSYGWIEMRQRTLRDDFLLCLRLAFLCRTRLADVLVALRLPAAFLSSSCGCFGCTFFSAICILLARRPPSGPTPISSAERGSLSVAAVTGDLDDIHSAMIASTRAAVTLELVAAVRNKGVDAFNEIMRMQA